MFYSQITLNDFKITAMKMTGIYSMIGAAAGMDLNVASTAFKSAAIGASVPLMFAGTMALGVVAVDKVCNLAMRNQ